MDAEQTQELRELQSADKPAPMVNAAGPDRTLIFGYDVDRQSFHVYIKGGKIHRYAYNHRGEAVYYDARDEWPADFLVPNKRIYPQFSDYEFCAHLIRLGVHVPFTNWSEPDPKRADYGLYNGRIFEGG